MRCVLFAITVAIQPVIASTQSLDGNFLWGACNGFSESETAFCYGYILGANDGGMYTALSVLSQTNNRDLLSTLEDISSALGYCTPNTATSEQVVDVVVSYLRENPEVRHKPAQVLFTDAMTEAFPCT